jgi:flagellar hook-basal body complex protein FliE
MSVEPVAFLASAQADAIESRLNAAAAPGAVAPGFDNWLSGEISRVNQQLLGAQKQTNDLALGKTQNLHDVMISIEEARLGLQLMVQIRTRALEAYQEILRMQV